MRTDENPTNQYTVPPVSRALAVLRHIASGGRCSNLSQSAQAVGINRTTLLRLLKTLEQERMIEEIPGAGGYRLGSGLIALASQALGERDILQIARLVLRSLVDDLELSAHFGVIDGRDIVYLARETPNAHLVSTVREGTRLPAHATTIGRILLGQMPKATLRKLYDHAEFEAYTDQTRTTLPSLEAQLADDRARGLAWSVGSFEPDIGSAAAPVFDHQGQAVGAINVTGHASKFAATSDMAPKIEASLLRAAVLLSENLGFRSKRADQL